MPVLPDGRHEKMAQGLAAGKTRDAAYTAAGYKPNRHNAARLSTKEHIIKRVAEIQQTKLTKAVEYAAVNVREQMHKLIGIVDAALAAKDYKAAGENQRFIMEMFGYKDMPTMTHDHMTDRASPLAPPAEPSEERKQDALNGNILKFGRVHQAIEKMVAERKKK